MSYFYDLENPGKFGFPNWICGTRGQSSLKPIKPGFFREQLDEKIPNSLLLSVTVNNV
jgi:hypothetical protein